MLAQLARGEANEVFLIPSEFSQAFGGLTRALERVSASPDPPAQRPMRLADASVNGPDPDLGEAASS
jgi:hypothetical protein